MKKFLIWIICILLSFGIIVTAFIVYDSREYFGEYFENERKKLNLRSEASVDSLLNVISIQQKQLDSLEISITQINEKNSAIIYQLENSIKVQKTLIHTQKELLLTK